MKVTLAPEAEREPIEGGPLCAIEVSAQVAHGFISAFERAAALLVEFPRLGAVWRGRSQAPHAVAGLGERGRVEGRLDVDEGAALDHLAAQVFDAQRLVLAVGDGGDDGVGAG